MTPERQALIDMVPMLEKLEDGVCTSYPYEACGGECESLGRDALEIALDALSPYPGKDRWSEPAASPEVKPTGEGAGLRGRPPGEIAQAFHEAYEDLAPHFGYRTRAASARPWAEVPKSNRDLMVATVRAVLFEPLPAPAPASEARCEECGCVCHIQPPGWLPSDVYHPHDCCDRPMQKGTGGAREGTP